MELFAYIDPGTGSLVLQAVIGTVLAASVVLRGFIRKFFYKIKSAFTRKTAAADDKE